MMGAAPCHSYILGFLSPLVLRMHGHIPHMAHGDLVPAGYVPNKLHRVGLGLWFQAEGTGSL